MKRNVLRTGAAILLAAASMAVADSRYRLETSTYELRYEDLPAAFDGFRIVQLSDLHGMTFGKDNRRLAAAVAAQRPDLIALTGDFARGEAELPAVSALLQKLQGLAPIYYVSGNHEWAGGCIWKLRSLLARFGVHSLENRYEPFARQGSQIIVAGVDDPYGWADQIRPDVLARQLRQDWPEDFVLWLGHRNDWVKRYPELPVDLILSGHAHGGIVRLPFVGGLLNNGHRLGAEYEAGVYHSGSYDMLVSRGLGNSVPVPRLFNRPEIVTVILRSTQA